MSLSYERTYHCRCGMTLHCGRSVTLKSLKQRMTYGGLIEGFPSRKWNDQILDSLATAPGRVLIPPPRRDFLRQPGDMDGLSRGGGRAPEWLPMIQCEGEFSSVFPRTGEAGDGSCLTVVWFQNEYAMPIDPSAAEAIQALDWNALAVDFEY